MKYTVKKSLKIRDYEAYGKAKAKYATEAGDAANGIYDLQYQLPGIIVRAALASGILSTTSGLTPEKVGDMEDFALLQEMQKAVVARLKDRSLDPTKS